MAHDYERIVKQLRIKADNSAVPDLERRMLRDKANELEAKHGPFKKPGAFTFTISPPTVRRSRHYDDWLDSIVEDLYLYGDE